MLNHNSWDFKIGQISVSQMLRHFLFWSKGKRKLKLSSSEFKNLESA